MTQHKTGSWKYGETGTYVSWPMTELVARVYTGEADAKLIAAAPQMLAALVNLHDAAEAQFGHTLSGDTPYAKAIFAARAAIAAAAATPDA